MVARAGARATPAGSLDITGRYVSRREWLVVPHGRRCALGQGKAASPAHFVRQAWRWPRRMRGIDQSATLRRTRAVRAPTRSARGGGASLCGAGPPRASWLFPAAAGFGLDPSRFSQGFRGISERGLLLRPSRPVTPSASGGGGPGASEWMGVDPEGCGGSWASGGTLVARGMPGRIYGTDSAPRCFPARMARGQEARPGVALARGPGTWGRGIPGVLPGCWDGGGPAARSAAWGRASRIASRIAPQARPAGRRAGRAACGLLLGQAWRGAQRNAEPAVAF